jgi:hypothetical protein
MIPYSLTFDQSTLASMIEHDAVIQRYRTFFSSIDWCPLLSCNQPHIHRGRPAHAEIAYVKAFLIKLIEGKQYVTQLRSFLIEHPHTLVIYPLITTLSKAGPQRDCVKLTKLRRVIGPVERIE